MDIWLNLPVLSELNCYFCCLMLMNNRKLNQIYRSMKKKNVWLVIGVIIAIVLLMIWLFVGTTLEEITNPETDPIVVEQNV